MAQMTIQQALDLALQHHQAGCLQEAEQLYRLLLTYQPEHADILHLLGVLTYQRGRLDEAATLIRQAIARKPNYPEACYNLGNVLKDQGRLDDAIAACRQAIALKPDFPEAHVTLGTALQQNGQLHEAVAACRRAVALKPDYPEAHYNLGTGLSELGQLEDAIAAYRQAIALQPDFADAHSNLGNALTGQGQMDEAVAACRRAIALKPRLSEPYVNLGNALTAQAQFDQAVAAYRQAIALKPECPNAYSNLGNALLKKGQLDEAVAACRQAITLKPDWPEAHLNLGNALSAKGQPDEAIVAYRRAIALKTGSCEPADNRGSARGDQASVVALGFVHPTAAPLPSDYPEARCNLGISLRDTGRIDGALAAFRQAAALAPGDARIHDNLVYTLLFQPGCDTRTIADEHRRWALHHAEPLKRHLQPHPNNRSPGRRLRIGYVSPDFRRHVVGHNMIPLLTQHDPQDFDVFCYAQVARPDSLTDSFRAVAHHWRDLIGRSDDQAARLVREDRIDILVDLALHMADNRLLLFARKPAPVQVTFAGYPGTTGLSTIDYRFSDPYLDPPDMDESVYSERTFRLPHSFWCYDPLDCGDVPLNPLPAAANGFITFGCLNNFCKVNPGVLRLWAAVLRAVPSSRLLLLAPEGAARRQTLELIAREAVDPRRIEFVTQRRRRQYLELYHRIDLGLDSFPYNGHTTSLDSFWMGVPVITLVGGTVVGRAGLSQLMNLSLPDLITYAPDEYIQIAAALAGDLPRLAHLRGSLRQRMAQSPLMDAPRFARGIEAAYRQMWQTWCATDS